MLNTINQTDKLVEEAIESNPIKAEQVAENISGENSPIETEAEQLNDLNPNNDEVKDEAIEQTPIKEKQEILDKLNNAGSSFMNVPQSKMTMNDDELIATYLNKPHPTIEGLTLAKTPILDSDSDYENFLDTNDENPRVGKWQEAYKSKWPTFKAKYEGKNFGDVNTEEYFSDVSNLYGKTPKYMNNYLPMDMLADKESFVGMLKDWIEDGYFKEEEIEHAIEEKPEQVIEDPKMPEEAKEEAAQVLDSDVRNDEANNEVVEETTEQLNSQLPALNLQDYHKDLELNGERGLSTLGERNLENRQLPALNDERGLDTVEDVDYTVLEDSDYIPATYTIEDLDKEIEEVGQWPVTNVDEAKAKQRKLMDLKSRRVAYGGTSKSDTNWDYDKSGATGGRVSPRAGIGSIGGAAGHGSMTSTRPTKMGDRHNSIASKAPLPHALEDNQGRVVSINGKVTTAPSSNNNGAFRSGSFGLMSKAANLKPIPSKAPVSGGPKHTGSPMVGANGMPEINLDDGKQALIERLKQLLAQLTDEEKKELGFSATLNQWNGKSLSKLDGYTLQDLIDKVEEYLDN